jgi:TetR/AcrR family fatty acid metabolism transcriptional regulator
VTESRSITGRRRKEGSRILSATSDLFSEKGFHQTTISEIAARAGVSDSVIYHYFRNKEDLLFSIAGIHMRDILARLQEHLEGILDPVSRLSKMVWFRFWYNETHENRTRILLFECRSNRSFYRHESYKLIRQYEDLLLGILKQGREQGAFRSDVDMRVVRDLILGALDWETLRWLSERHSRRSSTDVLEIMDLVCAMILAHPVQQKNPDKSIRIITAAEKLFSEKGYKQASISEIARLAEVAEGTVYEYFENKEDLLLSIPRVRFREHIDSLNELFMIKAPVRKLRRFIRYHFVLYLTQQEFLKTFLLDIQLNPRFYETEALASLRKYSGIVDEILDEGKSDGSFRPSASNGMFKNLLFGGFCHMAFRWLILNADDGSDKLSEAHEALSLLARAVSNEEMTQRSKT